MLMHVCIRYWYINVYMCILIHYSPIFDTTRNYFVFVIKLLHIIIINFFRQNMSRFQWYEMTVGQFEMQVECVLHFSDTVFLATCKF